MPFPSLILDCYLGSPDDGGYISSHIKFILADKLPLKLQARDTSLLTL